MHTVDEITGIIVDCAYHLHRELGPGLLERVYEALLAQMLAARGLAVERQTPIRLIINGIPFDEVFTADLIVEKQVVLELKAVEKINPVHSRQLLTYLKLLDKPVGLLINFGGETLKEGLKRVVHGYIPARMDRLLIPASTRHPPLHIERAPPGA